MFNVQITTETDAQMIANLLASDDSYIDASDVEFLRDHASETCELLQALASQRFVIEVERFTLSTSDVRFVMKKITLDAHELDVIKAHKLASRVHDNRVQFYLFDTYHACLQYVRAMH